MKQRQQQRTETIQEQRVSPAAALSMQQEEQPFSLTKAQLLAMGGTLVASGLLDMAQHFNPEWVAAGILATAVAGKATPLFQTAISMFVPTDPDVVEDVASRIVDAVAPLGETDLPQDTASKLKRLFHIGQNIEEPAQPKDAREDAGQPMPAKKGKAIADKASQPFIVPQFLLDEALGDIRALNKKGRVYFGDVINGAFSLDMAEMYHVLDVSSSGKGKSNRFRLMMMQLVDTCEVYYVNPLANAIKAVKDERKIEVWTPIFERLANEKPIKEALEIRAMMNALINEIQARNDQEAQNDFSWLDRPIFVFIDELPEVFKRCPEAIEMLDKVVRTGRNYLVFAYVASQTALVSDIGQNTASQAQYKTRIYGGGDKNSSNRMMKGTLPPDIERLLQSSGAGLTVMLAAELEDLAYVRAPLVTNEALFEYFRLPPFQLSEWLPAAKKTVPGKQNLLRDLSPDLSQQVSQSLSQAKKEPIQAQNIDVKVVKGESRESVKAPNEEVILDAMDALEDEEKPLTLHAIAKRAGLTWRQHEEIGEVATRHGYQLERGQGRRPSRAEN